MISSGESFLLQCLEDVIKNRFQRCKVKSATCDKREECLLNTEVANAIKASKDKAQYDACVKRLLSQKMRKLMRA